MRWLFAARPQDGLAKLPTVSFDNFLRMLGESSILEVVFQQDDVLEVVTSAQRFTTRVIRGLGTEWLVQRLVETKTPFSEGRRQPSSLSRSLRGAFVFLMPLIYLYMAYRMLRKVTEDSTQSLVEPKGRRRSRSGHNSPVTWASVAGMDAARRELMEVVGFLHDPERYIRLGARCPRGILLHGPPGCGKTLLARAVAHEAGVSLIVCSASDFVEVFVGRGAARVRDLFQRAEKCSPCILFFDELDALAKSRTSGGFGNDEREQTLNQLLTEMDGFDSSTWDHPQQDASSREGQGGEGQGRGIVIVIAATNRPDVLDSALMRPGRFDRHVRVELPNEEGRLAILRVHKAQRRVPLQDDACLKEIARGTVGCSGADLSNLLNESVMIALREDRDIVTSADLYAAMAKVHEMHELH